MMRLFHILLILVVIFSCSNSETEQPFNSMKLNVEIVPEFDKGGFSIAWDDTLGHRFSNEKRYLEIRPFDLHCYVLNKNNDTLGYYRGLSTPRQWTYFQTHNKDSLIFLKFSVGINHFSTYLANQTQASIEKFNDKYPEHTSFETIVLNINSALRKKKEVCLVQK